MGANYNFPSKFNIKQLENKIKEFIQSNKETIKRKYILDPQKQKQPIDYSILDNGIENKEFSYEDYVIQWSISGGNKINFTKVQLTFFNLGAFLGANGFLYSISVFYFYFIQMNTNRDKNSIKEDIINCLKYIDSGDIESLRIIWKTNLDNNTLRILKCAKNHLINIFRELIDDEIYEIITTQKNIWKKIWRKFKKGAKVVLCSIVFAITFGHYNLFYN